MKIEIQNYERFPNDPCAIDQNALDVLKNIYMGSKFNLQYKLEEDISEYYEVLTLNEIASRLPKLKIQTHQVIPGAIIWQYAEKIVRFYYKIICTFDYDPANPNCPVIVIDNTEDASYECWVEFENEPTFSEICELLQLDLHSSFTVSYTGNPYLAYLLE